MKFFSLLFLLILVGCANFETQYQTTSWLSEIWMPGRDFEVVSGDTVLEKEKLVEKKYNYIKQDTSNVYEVTPIQRRPSSEPKIIDKMVYPFESVLSIRRLPQKHIEKGMSKDEVQTIWGAPIRIDYAGNPRLQNERWVFNDRYGERKVFFEGGFVDGWEVN